MTPFCGEAGRRQSGETYAPARTFPGKTYAPGVINLRAWSAKPTRRRVPLNVIDITSAFLTNVTPSQCSRNWFRAVLMVGRKCRMSSFTRILMETGLIP